ncbi:HYR domain-containing protein, partial [Archangium sp.]|uniref:HYR domain-containing protein n=1 Tax=Archangium sp. TaxID=1872627 RepID=UPI002EDA250D
GTPAGTVRVKDIVVGSAGSSPQRLTAGGSVLFFVANDGDGLKLWMSNGTEAGTRRVDPSSAALNPEELTFTGGALYYSADEEGSGREPYAVYPAFFGDCTPPHVTCPAGVTVEATKPAGADVSYSAGATDDSGAAPTVSYSPATGSTFPVGDNPVSVTATDAAGNSDTCSFTVAVKDSRAPIITCPADVVLSATGADGAVVDYPAAQATDTISSVTLSYSAPSGSKFPVGDNQVQVTASDASGNTASCTFNVKVNAASGGDSKDSGCGCTAGFTAEAPWLLLGLFAPWMARRRRFRAWS